MSGTLTRSLLLACFLLVGGPNTGRGWPCEVDTTTDGQGLFTYRFHRGDYPNVWAVYTNNAIYMQSYGVLEVVDAPGWCHAIDGTGWINWSPTNGLVFLDDPVTFSVRSCLAESATYDAWPWWPPGGYPVGIITGSVYELPGRTNCLGGGYQNFIFTGPARPKLFIEQQGNELLLRWSTRSQRCQLESACEVDSVPFWSPVTNQPVVIGTNFTVTLSATNSLQLFRLSTPTVQIP